MSTLQFQFLILIIAGWVNRTQQDVIEYLERAVCSELVSGRKSLICWEDTGKYTEIGTPRRSCLRDWVAFRAHPGEFPDFGNSEFPTNEQGLP